MSKKHLTFWPKKNSASKERQHTCLHYCVVQTHTEDSSHRWQLNDYWIYDPTVRLYCKSAQLGDGTLVVRYRYLRRQCCVNSDNYANLCQSPGKLWMPINKLSLMPLLTREMHLHDHTIHPIICPALSCIYRAIKSVKSWNYTFLPWLTYETPKTMHLKWFIGSRVERRI